MVTSRDFYGAKNSQYLFEQHVMEFAGGLQGEISVDYGFHNGKYNNDNHCCSINNLVEVKVWILRDFSLDCSCVTG